MSDEVSNLRGLAASLPDKACCYVKINRIVWRESEPCGYHVRAEQYVTITNLDRLRSGEIHNTIGPET